MCDIIEYGRKKGHPHITVEFERDTSMRCTEVFIITTAPDGAETGVRHIISDKGEFILTGTPVKLIDGVDFI